MALGLVLWDAVAAQADLDKVALLSVTSKRDMGFFFFASGEFAEACGTSCMWARLRSSALSNTIYSRF